MRVHHQDVCLHCHRYATIDARNLCCQCYHHPEIRHRYPSSRRYPAEREPARRPQCRFPYSGEQICIDPGTQLGRPSNQDDGHDERMAAHAERVARECQEVWARPASDEELTISEAAAVLGVSRTTVQNRIWAGTIPARQTVVGSRSYYVIRRADLENTKP